MANFYGTIQSERTNKAQIGQRYLDVNLYYGNRANSILAVNVQINRPDDTGLVTVWVDGEKVKEIPND